VTPTAIPAVMPDHVIPADPASALRQWKRDLRTAHPHALDGAHIEELERWVFTIASLFGEEPSWVRRVETHVVIAPWAEPGRALSLLMELARGLPHCRSRELTCLDGSSVQTVEGPVAGRYLVASVTTPAVEAGESDGR
jgi:hypothetical protein